VLVGGILFNKDLNMNAKEQIEKAKKEIELLQKIDGSEVEKLISHVDGSGDIYTENDVDLMESRRVFREFFNKKEEIWRYYLSHDKNRLVVGYNYGKTKVLFYVGLDMLDIVSGGKCKIVTESTAHTKKTLVCE
jgi:hypothetical protein